MSLHIFPKPNSSFTEEFKKLLTLLLCPCCVSVTQLPVQKRWQLWETWRENFRHVESNKGLQKPNMLSFACVSECVRVYACVFVSKWARRGKKLNSLCLSFFFRFWECTKKTLHNIFTSNFYSLKQPVAIAWGCVCIPRGKLPAPVGPGICHGAIRSQRQ